MAVDIELIKAHARFFDHLVDLIPARFYSDDADQKVNLFSLKKAERQKVKQDFKLQYKVNKRSKLDPDAPATTLEQQKAAAASKGDEEGAGPSGHSLNLSGSKLTREQLKERLQQKIEVGHACMGGGRKACLHNCPFALFADEAMPVFLSIATCSPRSHMYS